MNSHVVLYQEAVVSSQARLLWIIFVVFKSLNEWIGILGLRCAHKYLANLSVCRSGIGFGAGLEMAQNDDIFGLLNKCSLSKEEEDDVEIIEEQTGEKSEDKDVQFMEISANLYQVAFASPNVPKFSLESGTRLFQDYPFLAIPWSNDLHFPSIGIHKYGVLPNKFSRVRMGIDVDKPLIRGRYVKRKEMQYWVEFIYDRLKFVCAYSGGIMHKSRLCDQFTEGVSVALYKASMLAREFRREEDEYPTDSFDIL
ncbi:hypothetical protein Syun_026060 [Stephania yunnanensis]|uniref:Uncharacterized protein n=1 Tax=Stephania yunnanensis TaxID=152371 RepID=A0AAP0HWP4_9MAGN